MKKGDRVKAISGPVSMDEESLNDWNELLNTKWFHRYRDDIMTIKEVHKENLYAVEENRCMWLGEWLTPYKDITEYQLEGDLFEL